MIVRVLGEGQYRVEEADAQPLFDLDKAVDEALATNDAAAFSSALDALIAAVRTAGTPVAPEVILPSDLVLPPEGASLAEVAELIASEDVDS